MFVSVPAQKTFQSASLERRIFWLVCKSHMNILQTCIIAKMSQSGCHRLCLCLFVHLCFHLSVCLCLVVCVLLYLSCCLCLFVFVCLALPVCLCLFVFMYLSLSVCIRLFVLGCFYASVCLCLCLYICAISVAVGVSLVVYVSAEMWIICISSWGRREIDHQKYTTFLTSWVFCSFGFAWFLCFLVCLFVCQSEEHLQHIDYFCSVEKSQILKRKPVKSTLARADDLRNLLDSRIGKWFWTFCKKIGWECKNSSLHWL